jgi:hypothetical protein
MPNLYRVLSPSANLFSSAQQSWAVFNMYFYKLIPFLGSLLLAFFLSSLSGKRRRRIFLLLPFFLALIHFSSDNLYGG